MTNDFYNKKATEFFKDTVNADMSKNYYPFLECLSKGQKILDAGCGSGRDSKAFIEMGYQVTALDGSETLCEMATAYIGQQVQHLQFQNITFENEFDGIWACATLLHVPSHELTDVLKKLKRALKPTGILYASFKYGNFEGERNGRYFTDLTEEKANKLLAACGFKDKKMWITTDVREGRGDEKWLNILAKREIR